MKKSAVILSLIAQVLAAAIDRDQGNDNVITRPFPMPPFSEGGPINWPGKREPAPAPLPKPDTVDLAGDHISTGPNPEEVQIVGMTYGGTGCPSGTVSHVLSDDRTIMTLIFDEYVASIGPGTTITDQRKNCQLNINLRYPGGFQYSVFSADYRGYAYLEEGVTGTQKSTYYFSGQTDQTSTTTEWKGPLDSDYLLHDEADNTSIVWSPCGGNGALNINSQIRLTSTDRDASGFLTNDSIDASFRQIVHVRWQECVPEN
ncbi:hypothetical protein AJ79_00130 [Helicocarpus griseus UAMH5409]|uniref:Secreted protein n=1 Tax=Helicocarpus griseus UAMH5409 TaxID=1447875 RepID=A0A2B7YC34_9EURO|nr:hypothetical protein AJ79_00130 [Helicocarpus griseus UAMH5409]